MSTEKHKWTDVPKQIDELADSLKLIMQKLEEDTQGCVVRRERGDNVDIGFDALADLDSIERQLRNVFASHDAPDMKEAVAETKPRRRRKSVSSSSRDASGRKRPVRKRKVEKYYYQDETLWLHCKPKTGNEYWHKAEAAAIDSVCSFVDSLALGEEFDFEALENGCDSVKSYQVRLVLRFLREKVRGVEKSSTRGRYVRKGQNVSMRLQDKIEALGPYPKDGGS